MKDRTQEMLAASKEVDDREAAHQAEVSEAVKGVGTLPAVKPHPVEELALEDEDADPFGGNHNNRRVAARIAREYRERKYLNSSTPTHVGDPEKAAADVAQSLRVTGQDLHYGSASDNPVEPEVQQPSLNMPKANADSPAAKKAAADKKAAASNGTKTEGDGQPPTWRPNAG